MQNSADEDRNTTHTPLGWLQVALGQIIEPSKRRVDPTKSKAMPYIGLEHIEKSTGRLLNHGTSAEIRSTKTRFYKGDLLYGRLRPYLNKVHVAEFDGMCSTDILVYPNSECLSTKFLQYRLLCDDFVNYANSNVSGVQHPRVSASAIAKFVIELPPLNEQHRVVESIEQLLEKVDTVEKSLEQVKDLLGDYRQSILNAAVDGSLTLPWREAHSDTLEPAASLIERANRDRQESWESPKYVEPLTIKRSELPILPVPWSWASLDILSRKVTSGPRGWRQFLGSGSALFVLVQNVRDGKISLDNPSYVDAPKNQEADRTRVEQGDVLVTIVGKAGIVALVEPDIGEAYVSQSVALVRPTQELNGRYLEYYLRASNWGKKYLSENEYGIGRGHLLLAHIKETPVAVPPFQEQTAIVRKVERNFSIIDRLENLAESALNDAKRLRASVLERAFTGRLVTQDLEDEPYSSLLECIEEERAERQMQEAGPKPQRTVSRPRIEGNVSGNQDTSLVDSGSEPQPIAEVLSVSEGTLTPEALFARCGYSAETIDLFYAELKGLIDEQRIHEVRGQNSITLRVVRDENS